MVQELFLIFILNINLHIQYIIFLLKIFKNNIYLFHQIIYHQLYLFLIYNINLYIVKVLLIHFSLNLNIFLYHLFFFILPYTFIFIIIKNKISIF